MKIRDFILIALCAAAMLWQAWLGLSDFNRLRQKIPDQMIIAAGPISEVHVRTTKRNKKYVRFAIHGHPVMFSLSDADPGLPKIEYLIPMLHPGVKAEVHYGPDGPRDIWSLRIGDQLLLTPAIAYNERKKEGMPAIGSFVFFLILGSGLLWLAWSSRREES